MKNIVCILLAVITALSLIACGNSETPTQSPAQQQATQMPETTAAAKEDNPFLEMLVGQWELVQTRNEDLQESFTIHADGTMEMDGKVYTWQMKEGIAGDGYELKLTARLMEGQEGYDPQSDNLCYVMKLERTAENTYIASVRDENAGRFADEQLFFRTCDYTVVELTLENMLQYLELEQEFVYVTNDFGFTERIDLWTRVRFREGLGYPSYCVAKFVFSKTVREVTFADRPDHYTLGATVYTEEGPADFLQYETPNVTSRMAYEFCVSERWSYVSDNMGGETHTCQMTFYELIGAEIILGRIYIPV